MSDITWTVGHVGEVPPSKEKIPYIAQLKSNDQMTEGQKVTITNYNLMRTTLIKAGLMEEK